MSNVGRIITDFYCNGYFSRDYDYAGAEIIAEGDEYIVIRKTNGMIETANFQKFEYERDKQGMPIGIKNLELDLDEKQELIDKWCK